MIFTTLERLAGPPPRSAGCGERARVVREGRIRHDVAAGDDAWASSAALTRGPPTGGWHAPASRTVFEALTTLRMSNGQDERT